MAEVQDLVKKINSLESENKGLKEALFALEKRVVQLEKGGSEPASSKTDPKAKHDEDEDNVDTGLATDADPTKDDDDDDEVKVPVPEEGKAKKSGWRTFLPSRRKRTPIPRSVVLDVKPWNDETDMNAMLKNVMTIKKEGLVWGEAVPAKGQVMCVMERDVFIDELCEEIKAAVPAVETVKVADT